MTLLRSEKLVRYSLSRIILGVGQEERDSRHESKKDDSRIDLPVDSGQRRHCE